jgi:hypothetical protein
MTSPRTGPRWLQERRWTAQRPLPARWVLPEGGMPPGPASAVTAFDFCAAMRRLVADIAQRVPELAHIDVSRLLVSFTPSRNRSKFGLQARVTPMRFRGGAELRRYRGVPYGVQRYTVDGRDILYVVTFCLPRFLDQPFEEKLITVFHELYHIGPDFDGDLRRHPGRYSVHSHSKREYDSRMAELVQPYLDGHPEPGRFEFLRNRYAELWKQHGGVFGVVVPRPKLYPVAWPAQFEHQAAANRLRIEE